MYHLLLISGEPHSKSPYKASYCVHAFYCCCLLTQAIILEARQTSQSLQNLKMLLNLVISCLVSFLIFKLVVVVTTLRKDVATAKAASVPVLVRWISPNTVFWLVFGDFIVSTSYRLGLRDWHFQRFYPAWELNERYKIHSELGDAFYCIAPGECRLYLADHDACIDVLKRPNDFGRDVKKMSMLNLYGRHIVTAEGAEWRRFKKAASSAFADINELVWRQTLSQTDDMLASWNKGGLVKTTVVDCKTFALNVLAGSLFSISYPFEEGAKVSSQDLDGEKSSANRYRDSLLTVTRNLFPILVFGGSALRSSFSPKKFQRIGVAVEEFRSYVKELVAKERLKIQQNHSSRQGLIANLTRVCEDQTHGAEENAATQAKFTMTENDIVSNTFMYTLGGTDTSAASLSNAIVHLSAHPSLQDWLAEEIQYYLKSGNPEDWSLDNFAKLKRCRAVLNETLRICHPIGKIFKTTNSAQTLTIKSQTIEVPPNTAIVLNLAGLHTNPEIWGEDAHIWDPTRWIHVESNTEPGIESEILLPDTTRGFLGWGLGQRICPGKRYSQVELVAAIALIFRESRVSFVPDPDETESEARLRMITMAQDMAFRMTHEIRNGDKIQLRWKTVEHDLATL
ncbi:unnamed protein product [Periconia digitata]|uniref:Cytochrome P450 n=1 Tax=Periconia digitata TaxID=1303443 RepID=A0A9W4XNM4_9PLEO|nr:unnamed protein product [Periconia digitata]